MFGCWCNIINDIFICGTAFEDKIHNDPWFDNKQCTMMHIALVATSALTHFPILIKDDYWVEFQISHPKFEARLTPKFSLISSNLPDAGAGVWWRERDLIHHKNPLSAKNWPAIHTVNSQHGKIERFYALEV